MDMKTLTMDEVARLAPSVVSEKPFAGVSAKYAFVPTTRMIEVAGNLGWKPFRVSESGTKKEERRGTQRHHISFYRPEFDTGKRGRDLAVGDVAYATLGLVNAHDATSSFQAFLEIWRKVCGNGLIAASGEVGVERIRHVGFTVGDAEKALQRLVGRIPELANSVERMQGRDLSETEQGEFAEQASLLRWDTVLPQRRIRVEDLLEIRRAQDKGDDLWHIYNRIQENLLRSRGVRIERTKLQGMGYRTYITRSRAIKSVDSNVSINKGLWALATGMMN